MATCVPFQTQLSSIMEVLVKAAVMEISKLVDDKCAFLHLEISRKQSEIEMLKRKLLTTESRNAQLQRGFENYMDRGTDGGTNCPHPAGDMKFSEIEDATVTFTIKEESPDEQIWISNASGPIGGSVQYSNPGNAPERQHLEDDRQLTHPEISRLKTSEFGDLYDSSQNTVDVTVQHFTVKTEKEENHSGFSQDGCQHSAGKQTQLSAEFSMDDREHQLWSSIMEINQIDSGFPDFSSMVDEYSNTFPEHADHNVVSNESKSNAGISQTSNQRQCNGLYNGEFQKDVAPSSVFQSRAQSGLLQQERQREQHIFQQRNSLQVANLRQPNENSESATATDKPQPQNTFTSGSYQTSTPQKPQSGTARGYVCSLCGKTYSFLHQFKMHQHDHKRKRAFWCAVCGKTFQCSSHLSIHHRTHTGEKPYSCGQCGKRFTQQSSLRVHQRAHSGERPYSCTQCGKTFILMHHLKRHRIVHS